MAQPVPFTGTPEDVPRFQPTPTVGINTPPAAFGVNIGEAIEHLGQTQEHVGGELLDRAFAMQELHEQATANATLADRNNQMLQATVDYGNLQGKAAVDAYPAFQQNLNKIRSDGAQGLSPYAAQQYNQESRNSLFRLNFSAATHARDENKKYVVGSNNAAMASLESQAQLDPDNPQANADSIRRIQDLAANNNHIAGIPEGSPEWDMNIRTATSSYVGNQIRGMAEKDPFKAQKLLDQSIANRDMVAGPVNAFGKNNVEQLQEFIQGKKASIGSRVIAHQAMSGAGMQYSAGVLSDDRVIAGLRGSEGGSYGFVGPDVTTRDGTTGHPIGHYGVMSYNLAPWLKDAGMSPMTEQQFRNDPAAQDQLATWKFQQYQKQYGSGTAAALAWFGGDGAVKQWQARGDAALDTIHDQNMTAREYLQNFNHGLAQTASLREVRTVGAKVSEALSPGDGETADAADQRVTAHWNLNQKMNADDTFNNLQTLDNIIVTGDQSGKVPTTVEELTMTPAAKAAWDELPSAKRLAYMNILSKNATGDLRWNDDRMLKWQMLQGLLPERPDEFLKETDNAAAMDLPWDARRKIITQRQQVYSHTYSNPNVTHALGTLQDQIQSIWPDAESRRSDTNYTLFTGILHDALQEFQANNNRPPKDEEIKVMGQQIMKQVGTGGFFGGKEPWFESIQSVPEEAANIIRSDPAWGGVVPSDDMVRRVWIGKTYQELYGKKTAEPGK